jgi:predicted nucleotidyltransferase
VKPWEKTTASNQLDTFHRKISRGYNYIIMKTLAEIRRILEAQKPQLMERYGVQLLGVYGSYVRGEQRSDSDIDILVELERPARISLIDLIELEESLGELLGVRVDMAIKSNLRKRIGQRIQAELTLLP